MKKLSSRYINPFTDFGFKKLFGQEANKDLLIDFLNQLLPEDQGPIKNLTYLKSTQLGRNKDERLVIFDLHCKDEKGEFFIVELQQAHQDFFKDRALYYSTRLFQKQSNKGSWNFELEKVFTIAIMNFTFKGSSKKENEVKSVIKLLDVETKETFYDKLTFIFLEMPRFTKTLDELESKYDQWLYLLCNLDKLKSIPERIEERIFMKLFDQAELANLSDEDVETYEESLKHMRDYANTIDSAERRGEKKGFVKPRLRVRNN